jgi:hypothetical protein
MMPWHALGSRPLYEFLLEIDDGARRWCPGLKSKPRSIASSSLRSMATNCRGSE